MLYIQMHVVILLRWVYRRCCDVGLSLWQEGSGVHELVRALYGISRNSKLDVRRLRCLFDGTAETAQHVPDMDWFCHPATGGL